MQLMNKTNQFNTCTLRMDELALEHYLGEEGGHLLMAEVSDKYGNSGWVSEFLYHQDGDTAAVSYTHLDVYKRQILEHFRIKQKSALQRNRMKMCYLRGLSLQHARTLLKSFSLKCRDRSVDVYKRQI